MRTLVEKNIFCFKATLKHVDKDSTFVARFNVLAEDKHKAQSILEEWLSVPARTGYKFECCVGIIQCPEYPCGYIVVDETLGADLDLIDRNQLLKHKRYVSLDRYEVDCVVDVDKIIEAPSVSNNNLVDAIIQDLKSKFKSVEELGFYAISAHNLNQIIEKYSPQGSKN